MKTVTAIAHVALRVTDIDRSLDFYVGKLGYAEMFRLDRDDRLWIVYLRITDTQYLELFPGGDGERAPGPDRIGPNHFCLEVDDIDAAISELAASASHRRRRRPSTVTTRPGSRTRTETGSN
jgi:lactoylglutathione lyase